MSKAYKEICPCNGCEERKVGCHAKCVAYNEWIKSGIEIKSEFVDYRKKRRKRK